jgi:TolB-like protein/Flp pilus assembly protein TadD
MKESIESGTESVDSRDARENTGSSAIRAPYSQDEVKEELRHLLSSKTFEGAEAHKRFLQFAVEQTLAGSSHEVKEFTLGVHVFNRGASFDPRLDPIVRVEARRLRSRLAKYYQTEGEDDPLRIELPSRGYVPAFRDRGAHAAIRETQPVPLTDASALVGRLDSSTPVASAASLKSPKGFQILRNQFSGKWRWALGVLLLGGIGLYAGSKILRDSRSSLSPSIAVIPFQNLGDVKDESFSDGLTEELINSLGRVQGLHVVGRTSAFQFRSKSIDVREIGKRLNVRTVLEGGVRIYGDQLRITAELVDTTNGYSVWSSSYERNFEDALFVQRDISEAIVSTLQETLSKMGTPPELKFSPAKASPVKVEAYRDYLRGLYFWNKQTTQSIEMAKSYFEKAIALDPNQAPFYTGLARCYVNLPSFSSQRARDVLPKIRELTFKALELDGSSPEAHIDLAYVSFLQYDWAAAEAEFKRGLELGPGDPIAHYWYATYLLNVGRLEEGLTESKVAQQLDPVSPSMPVRTARALYLLRRYDEAVEQYQNALLLDPQFLYAHLGLGTVYNQQRKYPQAIAEFKTAEERLGRNPSASSELARVYAVVGKASEARRILQGFLQQAGDGSFPAKPISKIYLTLGDKDKAFEWLGKAIEARDVFLYLKSDPIWDPVRNDPRFAVMLQNARLGPTP